jgi:vacuolar-type H+-ATPase subunit H
MSKARAGASETVAAGRSQAQADAQQMIDDARAAAQKEADKVAKGGDKTITKIHDNGESNRSTAVDVVLDAFKA